LERLVEDNVFPSLANQTAIEPLLLHATSDKDEMKESVPLILLADDMNLPPREPFSDETEKEETKFAARNKEEDDDEDENELNNETECYICKKLYWKLHDFYDKVSKPPFYSGS
jgi:hypothetical protein